MSSTKPLQESREPVVEESVEVESDVLLEEFVVVLESVFVEEPVEEDKLAKQLRLRSQSKHLPQLRLLL